MHRSVYLRFDLPAVQVYDELTQTVTALAEEPRVRHAAIAGASNTKYNQGYSVWKIAN